MDKNNKVFNSRVLTEIVRAAEDLLQNDEHLGYPQWSDRSGCNLSGSNSSDSSPLQADKLHDRLQKAKSPNDTLALNGPAQGNTCRGKNLVIGITGCVAVGKSTFAQILLTELRRCGYSAEVIATDGYLLDNRMLREKGLMGRKGFPESYDLIALNQLAADIASTGGRVGGVANMSGATGTKADILDRASVNKLSKSNRMSSTGSINATGASGANTLVVKQYDHSIYDVSGIKVVERPEIFIVEGLSALWEPLIDIVDLSIYIEGRAFRWYVKRFFELRAQHGDNAHFQQFADFSERQCKRKLKKIWRRVNMKNYAQNILPLRNYADFVIRKNHKHRMKLVK